MSSNTSAQPIAASGEGPGLTLYGGEGTGRRVTVRDLARAKRAGERWPMLTAYDAMIASVFDDAGIPVLLVGDSAGNNHLGYENTVPVTMDQLVMLTGAVVRGTKRALIVADLPFGSYQESPEQALRNGVRLLKEAGAGAVKLEGGQRSARQVEALVAAGVPVMAHLGLTPQSVHAFGGYRVQGRDAESAEQLLADAKTMQAAGAFAVVLECVPEDLAARVTEQLEIPTIGIGAGVRCDAQVLVWTDMAGMTTGHTAKFVKQYVDLRAVLGDAAKAFAGDVVGGAYPGPEHTFH
ncbi:3-methyl-2-oxobutanoate hydroxymethyltransferase [Embleya sp. NPDC050154]|uniref:3-methyl-2-oxobutanoate hydroxymethyltransferase n=1 Tax=unclassified Embleya TaxID=2699296 RepID=UPI00379C2D66|nr:3-methyl-2-oxobutanoate hydroxymethyltransferase [Embleya sp. NBC_00888]